MVDLISLRHSDLGVGASQALVVAGAFPTVDRRLIITTMITTKEKTRTTIK